MDAYTKTLVKHMAKGNGVELSKKHLAVLDYSYEYYLQNKRGPLFESIYRNVGVTQADLEDLFPQGLASIYSWLDLPNYKGTKLCKRMAELNIEDYREVYLDYSSTTPMRSEVIESLKAFYEDPSLFGNAHSAHELGKKSYEVLQEARKKIAQILQVSSKEIIFTSGGTEANNLAIKGLAFKELQKQGTKKHIIASKVEHPSVLASLEFLETLGFKVSYLDVDKDGVLRAKSIRRVLTSDTLLVCSMAVNNEVGSINPLNEIGRLCKEVDVPLFVDGVQAFGKIPIFPKDLEISLLSISGHKIYAPKGVGALYIKDGLELVPHNSGGAQEDNKRAGTEAVSIIHAFGLAAALRQEEMDREYKELCELREYFVEGLKKSKIKFIVNSSFDKTIPHIINIGFAGVDSGSLLLSLNKIGVQVSAGSACTAGEKESSHVLDAMGVKTNRYGSIRFSLGRKTTREDLDYLLKYLPLILKQLRDL